MQCVAAMPNKDTSQMGIANRTIGLTSVTRGYKPQAQRATARTRDATSRARLSWRASARGLAIWARAELVYATIDTLRLLAYLQYELGWRTRTRVEPVMNDWEPRGSESAPGHSWSSFATEPVRGAVER